MTVSLPFSQPIKVSVVYIYVGDGNGRTGRDLVAASRESLHLKEPKTVELITVCSSTIFQRNLTVSQTTL